MEASKQKIEDSKDDKDAQWSRFLQTAKDERQSKEKEFRKAGQDLVADLKSQKEEAIDIVGIIADTGMVGGFQQEADSEKKWAIGWNIVTVLALFGLVVFAVSAFMITVKGGFDLGLFGARVFVATSLGILAAYGARQAEKHRKAERKNRRLELEIKSIGPYLNELPEVERNEIKRKLADRMFGRVDESGKNGETESITGSSADLLKMALETIRSLSKN